MIDVMPKSLKSVFCGAVRFTVIDRTTAAMTATDIEGKLAGSMVGDTTLVATKYLHHLEWVVTGRKLHCR